MDFRLTNVEALWPKLDKAYKFDAAQNRSVPCDATDPDGSYELHIVVTEDQAKELAGKMRTAFNESEKVKGKTWDVKSLDDIPSFTRDEGAWRIKTSKKTYSDATSKPRQFMQDGGRVRPFGNCLAIRHQFGRAFAFAQRFAQREVTARRTAASQNQIAQTAQTRQRVTLPA